MKRWLALAAALVVLLAACGAVYYFLNMPYAAFRGELLIESQHGTSS